MYIDGMLVFDGTPQQRNAQGVELFDFQARRLERDRVLRGPVRAAGPVRRIQLGLRDAAVLVAGLLTSQARNRPAKLVAAPGEAA